MTSLLIDIGNSYLKWAIDSSLEGFVFGGRCKSAPESIDVLFTDHFQSLRPDNIFVASVGGNTVRQTLFAKAKSIWGIEAELLVSPASGCGVRNAYTNYSTLGSDRWAAMVAAFDEMKGPVCVVSSGTALTVDVVNPNGEHFGGYIIPGYALMQDCLAQGTCMDISQDNTPAVQLELGQSTEACIQNGVAMTISRFVDAVFKSAQIKLPGVRLILTGGDAERLQHQLGSESSIDPHLVLKGLGIIHRSCVARA